MSARSDACWQPNTTSSDITACSLTEEENWRRPQLLYSFFLLQSPLRLTLKDYKNYLWHISAGTTGKYFFWGTVLNKFIRPHKYLRKNKSKTCLKLINILSVICQIAETFSPKFEPVHWTEKWELQEATLRGVHSPTVRVAMPTATESGGGSREHRCQEPSCH